MLEIKSTKLFLCLSAALAAGTANADVTMQQHIEVQAGGVMSMLNSRVNVTTSIAGDKSRTETVMEAKSGMMGRLMKAGNNISITRLDKDLIWTLSAEKKQYSEMTFAQMRAQMDKSMQQLESMQGGGESALPVSEESCQWSPMVVNTDKTGKKEKFAGVKASQYIINVTRTCTDKTTKKACNITWTLENWMAKRMPGDDEMIAYTKAMAKKMGMEELMSQGQGMFAGLMAMFGSGWGDVFEEAYDLKGYPVKSVMSLEMGGENCTMAGGQTIAMDEMWGNAANAGLNAAVGTAAGHAGQAVGQEIAEHMGNSVGGSIAGSALGAASGELIGGMFNKFRKKKKPKPQPEVSTENAANASVAVFMIATEVTNISGSSVPSSDFEVPAGWKKITTR